MTVAALFLSQHREAVDHYKDKANAYLNRVVISRASFLDAGLVAVTDLPSRVLHFAYEFFRSLTVGILFLRELPRARFIDSTSALFQNIGQIVLAAVGVLCPHLIAKARKWADS